MAAALPVRPPPRQNLDGVMIDISSRRPHRVHVHQLARDRPRSPEIAISPRDEGRVGGGGAALAPHASPEPRRRDDRHQLTQTTSSPCPTSRPRPPEIARDRDLAACRVCAFRRKKVPHQWRTFKTQHASPPAEFMAGAKGASGCPTNRRKRLLLARGVLRQVARDRALAQR